MQIVNIKSGKVVADTARRVSRKPVAPKATRVQNADLWVSPVAYNMYTTYVNDYAPMAKYSRMNNFGMER